MSTRREHFREAERLIGIAKNCLTRLSEALDELPTHEIPVATQQLQLTVQLAQVHATLATTLPAASPEG